MTAINIHSITGANGALWGTETEDLDATVVRWEESKGVETHTNNEVDVIMVVVSGSGQAVVDGEAQALEPGAVIVIPKGVGRSITATQGALTYLNVHKRRRRLMPMMARPTG